MNRSSLHDNLHGFVRRYHRVMDGHSVCFVIMPISMPTHLQERYGHRDNHFSEIYRALIKPAIEKADLIPKSPVRDGTENIQAGIIDDLRNTDLVLADLSGLNPNVFLELGIRSALDKPTCLISDGLDKLPFDTGTLNTHTYDCMPMYGLNDEIEKLAVHIDATMRKTDGRNELWKYFGRGSADLRPADLNPQDAAVLAKVDRILAIVERSPERPAEPSEGQIAALIEAAHAALTDAGESGVHGATIGALARRHLGDGYQTFLNGSNLSVALQRSGLSIRTGKGGHFILGD